MMYEVLARKWRPQQFDEMVSQEAITRTLKNAIERGRVAHAYLLTGPRGVGKTTLARILAKALNCEAGPTPTPCDRCPSCIEIRKGTGVDVQEIDGASTGGIDSVRELRENVIYAPVRGKKKVYIIDEVHMLTGPAFNALLKTLEEPPSHVVFLLATTEPHKLPATILSRCQQFDLKRIPESLIVERLRLIAKEEGFQISEGGLRLLAREAQGSLRDAQGLLDQVVSFAGPQVTEEELIKTLGIIDTAVLKEAVDLLIAGDGAGIIRLVGRIYEAGHDLVQFWERLLSRVRDLNLVKLNVIRAEEEDPEGLEVLKGQADKVDRETLARVWDILMQAEYSVKRSGSPRVALELVLIKALEASRLMPIEEVIGRLEAMEARLGGAQVRSSQESGPGPEVVGSEGADPFRELVAFAHKRGGSIGGLLEQGRLVALTDDTIEIGFNEGNFALDQFADGKRRGALEAICREFFRREMKVVLKPLPRPPREGDDQSPVQMVLNQLGGKVVEIRDTKGRL